MRPRFVLSVAALLCAAPFAASAQELFVLDHACSYHGEAVSGEVYGFNSDAEAEETVAWIMEHTGLNPNFSIRAASVDNAAAVIRGSERFILYSQLFMRDVQNATGTNWANTSILAHEIGHHLQGHTLSGEGSRPVIELEADSFSGYVLRRMGASLDEALVAMRTLSSEQATSTHPARRARLAAITNGWMNADEQLGGGGGRTSPGNNSGDTTTNGGSSGGGAAPMNRDNSGGGSSTTTGGGGGAVPTSPDLPASNDFEGQVRFQLDQFQRVLSDNGYSRFGQDRLGVIDASASTRIEYTLSSGNEYTFVGACDYDCTDIDLKLYDASGNLLASDTAIDDRPAIQFTPDHGGTYYLEVVMYECDTPTCIWGVTAGRKDAGSGRNTTPNTNPSANDYRGQVQVQLDRMGNQMVSDGYQRFGQDRLGVIDQGASTSLTYELQRGYSYRFASACDVDCNDIDLKLYSSSGTLLESNTLTDDVPVITYTPNSSGNYRLEVIMYQCGTSDCFYGVTVGRQRSSSQSSGGTTTGSGAAANSRYGSQVQNKLDAADEWAASEGMSRTFNHYIDSLNDGDEDVLTVNLQSGTRYVVAGFCDEDCDDMDLSITDPNGAELDRDTLVDANPVLSFTAPTSGRYRIEVDMYDCNVNPCYYGIAIYQD